MDYSGGEREREREKESIGFLGHRRGLIDSLDTFIISIGVFYFYHFVSGLSAFGKTKRQLLGVGMEPGREFRVTRPDLADGYGMFLFGSSSIFKVLEAQV